MARLVARAVAALALVLGLSSVSLAFPVAWSFEGSFTDVGTDYANVGLSVGDKLFGGVLFSSNTPDLLPADSVRGDYDAILGFVSVPTLGAFWIFAGPNNRQRIVIENDVPQLPPYDFFEIFMRDTAPNTVLPNPS